MSSSATGYYGNHPEDNIEESTNAGKGFLSHICSRWEEATKQAEQAGIRTVRMRIGVGITAKGGALQKLIDAPLGYVRRFGNGRQHVSWISIDDLIAAILHLIVIDTIDGPVNLVSSNPVTNEEMIATIAKLRKRPFLPGVSKNLLKLLYGEMAEELLLANSHISNKKLIESGFRYTHNTFEEAVRSQLGLFSS